MSTRTKRPVFDSALQTLEHPALVLWAEQRTGQPSAMPWAQLIGHVCGGANRATLGGYVVPLVPDCEGIGRVESIAYEVFAESCTPSSLHDGVNDEHRASFAAFLEDRGLLIGEQAMLQRGVYPLAPARRNLKRLGVVDDGVQLDDVKQILVLGWNNERAAGDEVSIAGAFSE